MSGKLETYLNEVFAPYEELSQMRELKEELLHDLRERLTDLQTNGHSEEEAFHMTIDSIGDISEMVENITAQTRQLQQIVGMDFSKSNLQNSDFKEIAVHDGKFNYSNLQGSDFSFSDLTNSSFKCSNMERTLFHCANLTRAQFVKSDLKGATFKDCLFDGTVFRFSELGGVCFDGQRFVGAVFDYSGLRKTSFRGAHFLHVSFKTDVKKAIFDGATMDKATYALLRSYKADLSNVTVI